VLADRSIAPVIDEREPQAGIGRQRGLGDGVGRALLGRRPPRREVPVRVRIVPFLTLDHGVPSAQVHAPGADDHDWRPVVRVDRIAIDDVVEVRIKGRTILGRVTEINDRIVYFSPICPGAGWRHAKAREIVAHWRKTGRRGAGAADQSEPVAPLRGQLSFREARSEQPERDRVVRCHVERRHGL
jgi:hypothetical protein